jgi:TusE/DsrC/DsvC family sulfur relay protein
MANHTQDYAFPGKETQPPAGFPHAPSDWSPADAEAIAKAENLTLGEEHWQVIRALQDYYARHSEESVINVRELHDALDEHFHAQGGLKHLYLVFPGGPVAQGCRLAGLQAPAGAVDLSFGSVV